MRILPFALLSEAVAYLPAELCFRDLRNSLLLQDSQQSFARLAFTIAYFLVAPCAYFLARSTQAMTAFSRLIVLSRRARSDLWTVIAGIAAVATLALGVITYIYPRK